MMCIELPVTFLILMYLGQFSKMINIKIWKLNTFMEYLFDGGCHFSPFPFQTTYFLPNSPEEFQLHSFFPNRNNIISILKHIYNILDPFYTKLKHKFIRLYKIFYLLEEFFLK